MSQGKNVMLMVLGAAVLWILGAVVDALSSHGSFLTSLIAVSIDTYFRMGMLAVYTLIGVFILRSSTRQELALAKARETEGHHHILDDLPVGVYRMTPGGKILEANRKFAQLLGYSSIEELKSLNVNSLYVKQSDRTVFLQKLRDSPVTSEFELRRKDGRTIWIRDYPNPTISMTGSITRIDGVFVETNGIDAITNAVNDDKRLDVNRMMRERFLSSVTHELRTPLVSIKGYVDYVLAKQDGSVSERIRPSLEVIKRNADRLFDLVNDLLDVQRIESGKLVLKLESCNLPEIVDHCVEEMLPVMKQKEQKVRVEVPAKVLIIQGDRLRINEVLTNLLSNASKFTPNGGKIYVRIEDEGESMLVRVRDTGIGLDEADLERVFEPFAAIEKPTHIKGTGLGLSLAKRLVEAHDGKIWAESAGKGEGATFTFSLPNSKREEETVTVNG